MHGTHLMSRLSRFKSDIYLNVLLVITVMRTLIIDFQKNKNID